MKLRYLAIVLIVALVAVFAVSKAFCRAQTGLLVAEASTSSEDGGDDSGYTEFC